MTNDWLYRLTDPVDGSPIISVLNDKLITASGRQYSLLDGIPLFFKGDFHDELHNTHFTDEPLPASEYYQHYFTRGERLLDLGSGDGVMSARAAPLFEEVYCVNPGLRALRVAKKRGLRNMREVCAIAPYLPFPESFFDSVMNIFVVEHIPKQEIPTFFESIRRVLKPNGTLLIATDTLWFDRYTRKCWETLHNLRHGKFEISGHKTNSMHINLMVPRDLRRILHDEGFSIENETLFKILGRTARLLPRALLEDFATSMFVFKARLRA